MLIQELKRWVAMLEDDGYVAIDDGGLTVIEITRSGKLTGALIELGGIPEDVADGRYEKEDV